MSRRIAVGLVAALVLAAFSQSSHAGILYYEAILDGPSEAPPNASPGTGFASLVVDDVAHTLALSVVFQGLIGNTVAAHIHGPTAAAGTGTAGVATQVPSFVGFPLGVTSGMYNNTFDLTLLATYNPAFVTNNGGTAASAEAALLGAIANGKAYLNLHTNVFPGGEIRGFFSPVPEPATLAMLLSGAAGMAIAARCRRRLAVDVQA